jgi:hypothetical protein
MRGDLGSAAAHFADAMDEFTRMGCVIERWTTVASVLPVLLDSGHRELAAELLRELDEADVVVRRMHAPQVDRVRRSLHTQGSGPKELAELPPIGLDGLFTMARDRMREIAAGRGHPGAGPTPNSTPVANLDNDATKPDGELRKVGDLWQVTWAGTCVPVPDLKGMNDLAVLLARPGSDVPALDLAAGPGTRVSPSATIGDLRAPGDLGERIDAPARSAYAARIRELQSDLDEADTVGDAERGARVQAELDFLTAELSSAYGLRGPRRTGDPAERARAAVTARIRVALAKIRDAHGDLGRHLDRSIITGRFCGYRPEQPTTWTVLR